MDNLIVERYHRAVDKLHGTLFVPYQESGVMWMISREISCRGGFLCDDMGLGKTIQTISTMLANPVHRTLIIVPKSLTTQWESEINRFAPHLTVALYDGPDRNYDMGTYLNSDVTIAPYSVMTNRKKASKLVTVPLHDIGWGRVVLDEAHEIRTKKTKINISLNALSTKYRWILTGTPVFNNMMDFVTLCAFLRIPQLEVQQNFEAICKRKLLRRTKQDIAKFNPTLALPPCNFENIEIDMSVYEKEQYHEVYDKCCWEIKHAAHLPTALFEGYLRCRQALVHPQLYLDGMSVKNNTDPIEWDHPCTKTEKLRHFIKEHPDERSLIFCLFIQEMDIIQAMLIEENIETFRLDGSVTGHKRREQIDKFKIGNPNACFIIQIKAGGVGLNLQEASRVYITTPSWNPATELQAIGRAHRTGQTKPVYVKKLIFKSTMDLCSIEQTLVNLQEQKSKICAEVLLDKRIEKQVPAIKETDITIHELKNFFSL